MGLRQTNDCRSSLHFGGKKSTYNLCCITILQQQFKCICYDTCLFSTFTRSWDCVLIDRMFLIFQYHQSPLIPASPFFSLSDPPPLSLFSFTTPSNSFCSFPLFFLGAIIVFHYSYNNNITLSISIISFPIFQMVGCVLLRYSFAPCRHVCYDGVRI